MDIVLDCAAYQTPEHLDNLLKNAPDNIVAVYVKATQGLNYTDASAASLVAVCQKHNTPHAYYDFMTNDQMIAQEKFYTEFIHGLPPSTLKMMLDAEGSYNRWLAGVEHFEYALGSEPLLYAQLSNMSKYQGGKLLRWVAQYDSMSYYRPQQSEIDSYKQQGYVLWQFTDSYLGSSQDASVLLASMNDLRI